MGGMSASLLLTQCLQNDFVRPLAAGASLPNLLHIGFHEARRLLGEEPGESAIERVMRWAYAQPDERLRVLHLRDWHDAADPAQREHLGHFGAHCLEGSAGAAFAFSASPPPDKRVAVIDSRGLNDFIGTELQATLEPIIANTARCGLMGVWTEAKVTFLAYELRTRYPQMQLGVCAALTAGSSRAQHFAALEQLERLLGVTVFSSVAAFLRFLGGEAAALELPRHRSGARLSIDGELSSEDQDLVAYLFRDCREAKLSRLGGGFSGNLVLGCESRSREGHAQAPHVLKLGPVDSIAKERMAFERIEAVLGNSAPQIVDFADGRERAALKYRYASMGGGFSTTFKKLYTEGAPLERVRAVLDTVFGQHLGKFLAAAQLERLDLLDHYQFAPRWAPSVQRRVEELVGPAASRADELVVAGKQQPNVVRFYEGLGALVRPSSAVTAWVHGDLNGANIVIDGQHNVWLIDFFHTGPGHALKDLLKLENDLLYIMTPLLDEAELLEACRLTDAVLAIEDLSAPLPRLELDSPGLRRAWETLRHLRGFYPAILGAGGDERAPLQAWIGLLRYAVHTLSFEEASRLQKLWALYTACGLAERVGAALKA